MHEELTIYANEFATGIICSSADGSYFNSHWVHLLAVGIHNMVISKLKSIRFPHIFIKIYDFLLKHDAYKSFLQSPPDRGKGFDEWEF